MSTRVADRVDGWDREAVPDGHDGLRQLADADFSGVVRGGGATVYMTNGRAVGVDGGTVDSLADAPLTAHRAPSAALPLLAMMQGRSDEVKAKYYTEDTSLAEVDRTLSDGGFTGYVELSENVLSGDYYLVYHQGRSMSVAFVGNNARLIDGDEAFETANDEVGIYEVRPVEVEQVDLPEPGTAATGGADAGGSGAGVVATPEPEPQAEPEPPAEPEVDPGRGGEAERDPDPAPDTKAPAGEGQRAGEARTGGVSNGDQSAGGPGGSRREEPETGTGSGPNGADPGGEASVRASAEPAGSASGAGASTGAEAEERPTEARSRAERPATGTEPTASGPADEAEQEPRGAGAEPAESATAGEPASGGAGSPEAEPATEPRFETRSIPSLDPARSTADAVGPRADAPGAGEVGPEPSEPSTRGEATGATDRAAGGTEAGAATRAEPEPSPDRQPDAEPGRAAGSTRGADEPSAGGRETGGGAGPETVDRLREAVAEREQTVERLEGELEEATQRTEELEAELEAVRRERDDLAAEVERLEEELERVEAEFGVASGAERRLTPSEALDGTDVFVRYRQKDDPTLSEAHDGEFGRTEVTDNLRLEQHTQFEREAVAVNGQAFDPFIEERVEYRFVQWLVEELLFEVRETGQTDGLADLYDALPEVDRAELNGTIAVVYTEDGQEQRGQETFDLVLRDRMGNPLFVANLNNSRQGASEGMMEELITAAERVGASKDTLAGAFLVTESFFQPEALETAADATKGGLLSRDKRESFVNISRKRGFHLCLVEARGGNFYLAVPEL